MSETKPYQQMAELQYQMLFMASACKALADAGDEPEAVLALHVLGRQIREMAERFEPFMNLVEKFTAEENLQPVGGAR